MPNALFCAKHEQGNAFTILKNFQEKRFDINMLNGSL